MTPTLTATLAATLASVTLVSAEDGPVAVRLTHASCDSQTFWETPGVDALVLEAAGIAPAEFKLAEGDLADGANGEVTEEVRIIRREPKKDPVNLVVVSDNGDLDQGFIKFLVAHASEDLGEEVAVNVVAHQTLASAEHQEYVNETWDLWCSMPREYRAEWAG